jgi:hypothetical protein
MSVPRPATLGDLFPEAQGTGHAQRSVAGLTADSRKVKPGYVFVAVPGTKLDGMAFMPQALAAGAMALVGEAERPPTLNAAVAYVRVNEVRRALGRGFRPPDLRSARSQVGEPRNARRGHVGRPELRLSHHARSSHAP